MKKSFIYSTALLAAIGLSSAAQAARGEAQDCSPKQGAGVCNEAACKPCYCLGPDNYGVNAPVCPKTCDSDVTITVAGLYWTAHQDGMEYGILNNVEVNATNEPENIELEKLNILVDAQFLNPTFDREFGFRAGITYCTPCDGWDIGLTWTSFQGKAHSSDCDCAETQSVMPIWAAFQQFGQAGPIIANKIEANWDVDINLIDLQLGRNFWSSKYLALRPFMGIRVARLDQTYTICGKGGSFNYSKSSTFSATNQETKLENVYQGAGLMAGLDSTWNLGCGWGIYGNMATSLVYGSFDNKHKEYTRPATGGSAAKDDYIDIKETIKVSRAMLDLGLGLQWMGMVCECKYGVRVALGWEHHMFFDQNQMWRITRQARDTGTTGNYNRSGQNVYSQRRGDLDTQGWTLTLDLSF